ASRLSRGRIIPALLHCMDSGEASELARKIDPLDFPPFRLVILDGVESVEIASDGYELDWSTRPFDGAPLMFTSSGLGDELVEHPRRELYDRMVRSADASAGRQDAFHLHRWADRPHLSVMMSRADARTVSRTIVEVGHRAVAKM